MPLIPVPVGRPKLGPAAALIQIRWRWEANGHDLETAIQETLPAMSWWTRLTIRARLAEARRMLLRTERHDALFYMRPEQPVDEEELLHLAAARSSSVVE